MQEHMNKRTLHGMYLHWFKEHIVPTRWWLRKQQEIDEKVIGLLPIHWKKRLEYWLTGCPHGCLRFYDQTRGGSIPGYRSIFHFFLGGSRRIPSNGQYATEDLVKGFGVPPTNVGDRDGDTALHLAFEHSYETQDARKMLAKLWKVAKLDINTSNNRGQTPLHIAVRQNDSVVVAYLLEECNANIAAADEYGNTALHHAAKSEQQRVFHTLLDASIGHTSSQYNGNTDKLGELTPTQARPAVVNMKNTNGESVLHLVVRHGWSEEVKWLIDGEADLNTSDNAGNAPLHTAVRRRSRYNCKQLIQAGADINATDINGNTSLHLAARVDDLELGKLLIEQGADINATNTDGDTSLHIAARADKFEFGKILVEQGADINATNNKGRTPGNVLHIFAAIPSELEIFLAELYHYGKRTLGDNPMTRCNTRKGESKRRRKNADDP